MDTILEPAGVNLLILEIDKNFIYESHPEVFSGDDSLTKEDAKDLQKYARSLGIDIVPLFQSLGHQGWGGSRSALLQAYPEFDETPDTPLDAKWAEIFCRSWCPQHPDVNEIVFDLLDEIIEAFSPNYFHIGMDEVYEIASNQCKRCRGGNRAKLFAKSVNDMYTYLSEEKDLEVMMWGDRLLDAELFGYDNWEADTFGTYKAIDQIPKDIIILDWHYDDREKGYPTSLYLMEHDFRVMPACWFKKDVAKELFSQTKNDSIKHNLEDNFFGKLVTSWNSWNEHAYAPFDKFNNKSDSDKYDSDDVLYRLFNVIKNVRN